MRQMGKAKRPDRATKRPTRTSQPHKEASFQAPGADSGHPKATK